MKKILYISAVIIMLAGVLSFSSCKKDPAEAANARIEEAVSKLTLPQPLKDNTTLTDCYYRGKVLTFRNETTKEKLSKLDIDQSRAKTLENLRGGLLPQALVKNVVKAGASIQFIIVCEQDSVSYVFTPEELE